MCHVTDTRTRKNNVKKDWKEFQTTFITLLPIIISSYRYNRSKNAAEIMKKRVSNRKHDNNYTRRNKSWFDLGCKTLRKNSIRALRNIRIANTHDALDTYKHLKADYKAMIKVKTRPVF